MFTQKPDFEEKEESNWQILGWWERRRFLFNLILFAGASISIWLIRIMVKVEPGEDVVEPFALIGMFILLNVIYTFGWLIELNASVELRRREKLFQRFIYFSLCILFLSPVVNFIYLLASFV